MAQADVQRFLQNRGYTLTAQTRFIAALDAVKEKGLVAYVDAAAKADGERSALFFVESAEMLQYAHVVMPEKLCAFIIWVWPLGARALEGAHVLREGTKHAACGRV